MCLLMVLCDLFRGDLVMVVKLSAILGGNVELLAAAQQFLGQALVISRVVAVEESLVAALDDEFGDIHGCL